MHAASFRRASPAGLLTFFAVTLGVTPAAARPARPVRPALNLFSGPIIVMDVNRVFCPVHNVGFVCYDQTGSGTLEGGFWPKGTPDNYVFNSGLQIGGVIPNKYPGFTWAGDTVGAYFMDPQGIQYEGEGLTNVSTSTDPADLASWPKGAIVRDTAIYNSILIGDTTVSQQDVWVRVWDGNPSRLGSGGRTHPMGILVEERGMAWNYPTGNEDVLYFVYTFTNVTASDPMVYDTSKTLNPDPLVRQEIAAIGAKFQALNSQAFGVTIPPGGYDIDNVFAAFFEDADVANFSQNYSSLDFVFSLGFAYVGTFKEATWEPFPVDIFGPPLYPAPGFTGVKYLRSPIDPATGKEVGLTLFSNTTNPSSIPSPYPDMFGAKQLYRYLSGTSAPPADQPCTNQGRQLQLHYCYIAQVPADTRFFQSSGPFTLHPGEAQTIVVAYLFAAPTPTVARFVGTTPGLQPGYPATGDSIFKNPAAVNVVDSATGWVSATDLNGDNSIEQNEVTTVPGSLLNKAIRAQAVFDAKFLLPFSPKAPLFFLVPGDNQVSVVWQQSPSEKSGNLYYAVANDATSPLYDPDFQQFDIEGYRIYRGRTSSVLTLVAQFDYNGTTIKDYTGAFDYGAHCAPELGVQTGCPVTFNTVPPIPKTAPSVSHALVGNVVQVPAGGRVKLADGSVLVIKADTAVTGGNSGFPALSDGGVPFVYLDATVRNSFQYFYAVTAFSVNSLASGPSSLESARATKSVTPRAIATNAKTTQTVLSVVGSDGTVLSPSAPYPTIDANTGTFNGNMPPANDGALAVLAATELLPKGDVLVRIDSILPGFTPDIGAVPTMFLEFISGNTTVKRVVPLQEPGRTSTSTTNYFLDQAIVPVDTPEAKRFGIALSTLLAAHFTAITPPIQQTAPAVSVINGRYGTGTDAQRYLAHSRWFDQGSPEPANPTIVGYADKSHNSGQLTGVDSIWAPQAYRVPLTFIDANFRGYSFGATSWYPADFLVTWNADSSITVFDSTHHVPLRYARTGGTGWGFINLRAVTAAGVAPADLADGTGTANTSVVGYHTIYATPPTCFPDWWAINCIALESKAQVEPLDFASTGASQGNGIALMVNGEAFLMKLTGGVLPAAGTKWHLRAVTGDESATCTPAFGPTMTGCSGYTFTGPSVRPSYAPGLTYKLTVQQKYAVNTTSAADLSKIHTVPDPYYVTDALEFVANVKVLKFVHLPAQCIIRIYSTSGILVRIIAHNDPTGGGEETWDLRSRNNQFVASGVYFYHIEAPDGSTKVGRMTVINFAP